MNDWRISIISFEIITVNRNDHDSEIFLNKYSNAKKKNKLLCGCGEGEKLECSRKGKKERRGGTGFDRFEIFKERVSFRGVLNGEKRGVADGRGSRPRKSVKIFRERREF